MRFLPWLSFVILIAVLSSCRKDQSPEDFQVHLEADFPLKDIVFDKNENWIACGGEIFESGYVIKETRSNVDLENDLVSFKCLNALHQYQNSFDSIIIISPGVHTFGVYQTDDWNFFPIQDNVILRGVIQFNGHYYLAGGAGLSVGVIYEYDEDINLVRRTALENDLYFIDQAEGRAFAGGFGVLMYSDDLSTWNTLDEFEDHWLDMEYREDVGILVLGASGRIIKSSNLGETWEELSKPQFSGVSDFRDMIIFEDKIYVACGENICVSDLDDIEWTQVKLDNTGEINRLNGNKERIYFVTNSGKLASIAH